MSQNNVQSKLQSELAEKTLEAFDAVIKERSQHYQNNPTEKPTPDAIAQLIERYSTENMLISGAANLFPGPWGMLAIIPEIILIIRKQLNMIYDISVAYGKANELNRELLAGIFLSAMGSGTGGLLVIQGGKVLVKRVSLRLFQKVIAILGGKITQQVLKSIVAKWLPIVGVAAMAAWSKYSTRAIGQKAVEIFEKSIEVVETPTDDDSIIESIVVEPISKSNEVNPDYVVLKIKALTNLMKVDRQLKSEEYAFIQSVIEHSDLPVETKNHLNDLLKEEKTTPVDFAAFAKQPDAAINTLLDMIALAKRDQEFHPAEKFYIQQAGKLMGIPESSVEALLASS